MIQSREAESPPMTDNPAFNFFADKLRYETDPADVYADMEIRSAPGFVLLDVRSPADYADKHVEGAASLPHRDITPRTPGGIPR